MKSKVLENKRIKEEKLLSSALELFSEHDIQDITIQDIVDKAGVAKGTFYLYFKDKYQIQNVLIHKESQKLFKEANSVVKDMQIDNFEDKQIALVDQVLSLLEKNPFMLRFIKRNLSWGIFHNQMNAVMDDDELNILDQFKKEALEAGYVYENPEIIFYIIIELVGSSCYSSILCNIPKPIDEFKKDLFKCIRAILKDGKVG